MFFFSFYRIENIKKKIAESIENLSIDDFKFDIGTSKFEISPKEITTKKIRKFDGTITYEAEIQFDKPFSSLNNPKRLFEVNADNGELFKNEFEDCDKVEIKYFYIIAFLTNKEKYNLIKSKLYKLISYDRYYGFLIPLYLQEFIGGWKFIEYNIPYVTDTKEFSKDYETILLEEIKEYLKRKLYEL